MVQSLFQHGDLEGEYIHKITRWRFVDTASRMAPSNMFTFRDLDKVAYDFQTQEYYVLHKIDPGFIPVWKLISAVEAQGEPNTLYSIGTGVSLIGPKVGFGLGIRSLTGFTNRIVVTELGDGTVRVDIAPNFVALVGAKVDRSELGTSAYENIDISSTDVGLPSSPAMLKKGHYGLGWRAVPVEDLDAVYENGFYKATGVINGAIPGASGIVNYLTHKGEVDNGYQLGVTNSPGQIPKAYMRVVNSIEGMALWGSWVELMHASNIVKNVQTSMPAALDAGANIVLDYDPLTSVTTISADFTLGTALEEFIIDNVADSLVAGPNITIFYNDALGTITITGTGGGGNFLGLLDTPNTYAGHGGKNVRVKADETGLEFLPGGGGTGDTDLSIGTIDGTTVEIVSSTGTAAVIPAATATDAGVMSAADKVIVSGLPSDLAEYIRDTVASFCVAGTNVTITQDDAGNTLTFAASGGGGGGATNLAYTASPTNGVVTSDTGTDATVPLADATNAGLQSPAQFSTVAGLPADLAEFVRDTVAAFLTNGTNITITHNDAGDTLTISRTGSQDVSTISNFEEAVQDIIGFGALTAGSNISLSYNDVGNTLTINGVLTPDVAAIEALTGTTGLLRKTAADTWTLDTSTYLTANQTITVTGDATGSGTTSITLTIPADTVTFAKMQNIATNKLLGRSTSGSGDVEEITLGTNLSMTAGVLNASGGGGGSPLAFYDYWHDCPVGVGDAAISSMFTGAAIASGNNTGTVSGQATTWLPPGVHLRSSTTANSGYRYINNWNSIYFGTEALTFLGQVTWVDSFTDKVGFIGFLDNNSVSDPTDGVYFKQIGNTFSINTANSGSIISTSSGYTMTLGVTYTYIVESTDTQADFKVYADQSTTPVYTGSLTTGIPVTSARSTGYGVILLEISTVANSVCFLRRMGIGTLAAYNKLFN